MIDVTSHIKNLSISLEALSRVSGYGASTLLIEVEILLREEIKKAKQENKAQSSTTQTPTNSQISTDDDIPF